MKKLLFSVGFLIFFLLLFFALPLQAQYISLSATSCPILGQISRVCTSTKEYQDYECQIAAGDRCFSIQKKLDNVSESCRDYCVTNELWTCPDDENNITAEEYETRCGAPSKKLLEEYNTCRTTYAWQESTKGACTAEGMVCTNKKGGDERWFSRCLTADELVAENNSGSLFDTKACYRACQATHDTCTESCKTREFFAEGIDEECMKPCREPRRLCNLKCYEAEIASLKKSQSYDADQQEKDTISQTQNNDQTSIDNSGAPPYQIFGQFDNGIPLFVGGWFRAVADAFLVDGGINAWKSFGEAMLFSRDEREIGELIEGLTDEQIERSYGMTRDQVIDRKPLITESEVARLKKIQEERAALGESPYQAEIIKGPVQIKSPNGSTWKELKAGEKILPGSTIYTGMDTTTLISIEGQGVIEVLPFTEITVSKQGLEQANQEKKTTTDIKIRKGEIEINVDPFIPSTPADPTNAGWGLNVNGAFYSAAVRGTHFWVRHDDQRHIAIVGVYDGKVEVRVAGSPNSTLITPKDGKPGIIALTSKISYLKILIVSVTFLLFIGFLIVFLRRKRKPTTIKSKKLLR